jgi:hypothetical protein
MAKLLGGVMLSLSVSIGCGAILVARSNRAYAPLNSRIWFAQASDLSGGAVTFEFELVWSAPPDRSE